MRSNIRHSTDTLGTGEGACAYCGRVYDCFTTMATCAGCGEFLYTYSTWSGSSSEFKYDEEPQEEHPRVRNPLPRPVHKDVHKKKMIGKPQELRRVRMYQFR